MKKLITAALVAVLTMAVFGCTPASSNQSTPSGQPAKNVAKEFEPNLGGIKLGDSREQVVQSFGTNFKQTTFDEDYSLGEPFVKLIFSNGITVVLGSNSNSVLEIETISPSTSNNLGVKIGDKAQNVLGNYRSKYKEANSNQGEGKLNGWFLINDRKELVIFDFDKDEAWGNAIIKPEAQVERIRLTNFRYMD